MLARPRLPCGVAVDDPREGDAAAGPRGKRLIRIQRIRIALVAARIALAPWGRARRVSVRGSAVVSAGRATVCRSWLFHAANVMRVGVPYVRQHPAPARDVSRTSATAGGDVEALSSNDGTTFSVVSRCRQDIFFFGAMNEIALLTLWRARCGRCGEYSLRGHAAIRTPIPCGSESMSRLGAAMSVRPAPAASLLKAWSASIRACWLLSPWIDSAVKPSFSS